MKKTTVRNLGVYLNPRFRKTDHQLVRRMNKLPPILSIIADNQTTQNNLHVVKWVDMNGFINVAFQIVGPQNLVNDTDHIGSTSVVFAQTDTDKIVINAIHITTDGITSKNEHKILGTCGVDELTETFIMEKLKEFLDFAEVA